MGAAGLEVLLAVAGGGVDEARAVGRRDVLRRQHAADPVHERVQVFELEQVAAGHRRQHAVGDRVGLRVAVGRHGLAVPLGQHLVAAVARLRRPLDDGRRGRLAAEHFFAQGGRDDGDPRTVAVVGDEVVIDLGVDRDGEVRRQRPGRRRPDQQRHGGVLAQAELALDHPRIGERELDEDAHVIAVLVFELRVGEGGLIRGRPVDGLEPLVDQPVLDEPGEHLQRRRLVGGRHRQVRVGPVAEDAEPLELLRLHADVLRGVVAALLAHLDRRHLPQLRPQVLCDLVLDRQPVAVPARHVRRAVPLHRAEPQHDVLQHLVDDVPQVDVAVGERRPVVERERRVAGVPLLDALVQPRRPPLFKPGRLVLHEAGLHREVRPRQVEGLLVADLIGGLRHRRVVSSG